MHCLECSTDNTERPAVAVCQGCGAGVCAHHAHTVRRTERTGPPLGPAGTRQARTVLCPACAAATEAA
ncbi:MULTISPECIES: DUF2180 family protein [unclassified Streptomyces]|uniref:DUF2180 family protein n=1 Tax=unclassified Streptomyces TaxID=2593676 RepID=UPI0033BE61EE